MAQHYQEKGAMHFESDCGQSILQHSKRTIWRHHDNLRTENLDRESWVSSCIVASGQHWIRHRNKVTGLMAMRMSMEDDSCLLVVQETEPVRSHWWPRGYLYM